MSGCNLIVSAHVSETSEEEVETYSACVTFMARWFAKQDGARGKDTPALFEEFRTNVCTVMKSGAIKGD